MSHGSGVQTWSSPAWRRLAVTWLDDELAAAGVERTGDVEQPRVRPWATLLTAPTTGGRVWLKAAGPGTAFEVGLYRLLDRVVPDRVLPPLAVDLARSWVLLPDGGPPVGERLAGQELIDALRIALPQYGQLQRDLAPHADDILTLGVSDMRASVMPIRFDEALDAVQRDVAQRGGPADRETVARVVALRGSVADWCDRLVSAPGGASLDHNDLHPWNILLSDPTGGRGGARFYDWGDSVLAHPFASMLVALGFVQARVLRVGVDDPQVLRLRDSYLDVFSDLGPHAELVETLELACRVAKIARALTWNRALRALDADEVDEGWAGAPLACLASLLDGSHLGGA